jgi:hypothetical protein
VTFYLTDVAGQPLSPNRWVNLPKEIKVRVDFRDPLFCGLFVHVGFGKAQLERRATSFASSSNSLHAALQRVSPS